MLPAKNMAKIKRCNNLLLLILKKNLKVFSLINTTTKGRNKITNKNLTSKVPIKETSSEIILAIIGFTLNARTAISIKEKGVCFTMLS